MKRHPAYTAFLLVMTVLLLCGIALLVWGAVTHATPAFPRPMMIPPQVHHG